MGEAGAGGAGDGERRTSRANPSLIDLIADEAAETCVAGACSRRGAVGDARRERVARGGRGAAAVVARQYLHRLSPVFASSSCPFAY